MDPSKRQVTRLPLSELWNDQGVIKASRGRSLDREMIRGLLRTGDVRFVVAGLGPKLRWIPLSDRFRFWKEEAAVRLVETYSFRLEDFPDGLAYVATEWVVDDEPPIVLLEAHH